VKRDLLEGSELVWRDLGEEGPQDPVWNVESEVGDVAKVVAND
jgi:hypothetical protein